MKKKIVRELMIPFAEYSTASEEATLFDAVMALEKALEESDHTRFPHKAVLIYDKDNNIVGKVSQLDILRALEPKYETMGIPGSLSRFGLTPKFQKTMLEQLRFWDKPMNDICRKAVRIKVKEFMYTPDEGEYIDEDASFDELRELIKKSDIVLDGILGTGFKLPLRKAVFAPLQVFSEFEILPEIIAVDCPSGVDCDTGKTAEERDQDRFERSHRLVWIV